VEKISKSVKWNEIGQHSLHHGGISAQLMTTRECADYLGIPRRTLEDMRYRRYGPPFIRPGVEANSKVYYRVNAVNEWLATLDAIARRRRLLPARRRRIVK